MHFIRLSDANLEEVLKFILDDLEAIEPLIESLSIGKEDCSAFFRSLLDEAVRSKVSYVVKGDDGKIAGVRLSTFLTRGENDSETEYTPTPELSPNLERAQCLLWHLNRQFWQNMSPDIEKVYYLMAVILAPRFRYTDLADKLVHHNMDELRTMGAQGLVANAGIFHNDKLLEMLGFRIMAEAIDGAVNNSIRKNAFEYDDNTLKTQLVYKEMWRGEELGTRIVI